MKSQSKKNLLGDLHPCIPEIVALDLLSVNYDLDNPQRDQTLLNHLQAFQSPLVPQDIHDQGFIELLGIITADKRFLNQHRISKKTKKSGSKGNRLEISSSLISQSPSLEIPLLSSSAANANQKTSWQKTVFKFLSGSFSKSQENSQKPQK